MKQLFCLLIAINFSVAAQIKGVVKDEISGKPIPYVNIWIENQNIGTTAEENGEYSINSKEENINLIFSALGYEKKTINSSQSKEIKLQPIATELEEIIVQKKKNSKTFEVGNFNKRKINFYYGCWDKPWIIAKFFSSNDTIQQTPFIEKLTIMSSSYKNGASFNLRILEANLDGSPSNDLLDQNIVVKVQKGKHNNEIDLRQFNIRFPKNGIFISVEFLIIEANKYDVEVSFPEAGKKIMSSYQPSIGTVPADFSTTWRYSVGRWKKFETKNKNEEPKAYFDKYSELAIKLTLSN